ncbi:MAG: hypothetical protein F6K41_18430 [Symploca sp. SIO3E6]|nr:hypothetical protein [Caldora sp. SIO3E6]
MSPPTLIFFDFNSPNQESGGFKEMGETREIFPIPNSQFPIPDSQTTKDN